MSTSSHPIPNSYWAAPGTFLAGPWPLNSERADSRARISSLLAAGIRTVIDLRTPAEPPSCRSLLNKLSDVSQAPLWIGVPFLDGTAPSALQMVSVLDVIDGALARNRPVYVHCQGGLGRTGTVVACWWIRHGRYTAEQALEQLTIRRIGQPNAHRISPETGVQFRRVKEWYTGR